MSDLISGAAFIERVCEAQGVDSTHVRRVVIDAPFNGVARIYIEMNGSQRTLSVELSDLDIEAEVLGGDTYICPECGEPGLPSALDGDCCTNCANRRRGT